MTTPTRTASGDVPPVVPAPKHLLRDDDLLQRRSGRWIDRWEPEDAEFWERVGARTVRRNLVFSILSEHIGFSVCGPSGRSWSCSCRRPSTASASPTSSC